MLKTSIRILAGGIAAAGLCAGATMVGPLKPTRAEADQPAADSQDRREQASDLLRRARRAMAQNDLAAAESLISDAEALDVRYGFLHVGDTPKKVRRDLERKRDAARGSSRGANHLLSQLGLQKKATRTDPFAQHSVTGSSTPRGDGLRFDAGHTGRTGSLNQTTTPATLPRLHEVAPSPGAWATATDQPLTPSGRSRLASDLGVSPGTLPANRSVTRLPSVAAGPRAATPTSNTYTVDAHSQKLLLQARRALALGDVRRATGLVKQAKLLQTSYAPLDDTPEKVDAAIRQYQQVAAEADGTDAHRRRKVRMLIGQAEALLRHHDYDSAEQLAVQASREKLEYGAFEARPQDLLDRIGAARPQGHESSVAAPAEGARNWPSEKRWDPSVPVPPESAVAEASDLPGPSAAARQQALALARAAREALKTGQLARAERLAQQADRLGVAPQAVECCRGRRRGRQTRHRHLLGRRPGLARRLRSVERSDPQRAGRAHAIRAVGWRPAAWAGAEHPHPGAARGPSAHRTRGPAGRHGHREWSVAVCPGRSGSAGARHPEGVSVLPPGRRLSRPV